MCQYSLHFLHTKHTHWLCLRAYATSRSKFTPIGLWPKLLPARIKCSSKKLAICIIQAEHYHGKPRRNGCKKQGLSGHRNWLRVHEYE